MYLVLISAGCTTRAMILPDQSAIAPDSSVLAFSVNTGTTSKDRAWIRPTGINVQFGDETVSIDLDDRKSGVQRVLMEVPTTTVMFSGFEVESGAGIYWSRYQTGYSQPMTLPQGEITYLGRIEIEDARFAETAGGSRVQPYAVKLVFTDALADDLPAWRQEYQIFDTLSSVGTFAVNWTGQDYLDLWRKRSSSYYTDSYLERALEGIEGAPVRGPLPAQEPP